MTPAQCRAAGVRAGMTQADFARHQGDVAVERTDLLWAMA